jgi:hypothetical protein
MKKIFSILRTAKHYAWIAFLSMFPISALIENAEAAIEKEKTKKDN